MNGGSEPGFCRNDKINADAFIMQICRNSKFVLCAENMRDKYDKMILFIKIPFCGKGYITGGCFFEQLY